MTMIGYARVSTLDQNLDLQVDALKAAGCTKIFVEKGSGANRSRPELTKALNFVRAGDVFVCWKLDRVARSVQHLIDVTDHLKRNKVQFKSLQDAIDTTTATGTLMFQMLAAFAEFERNVIIERTLAGLAAAKARGRVGGRPKGLRRIGGKWVRTEQVAA
jgi:DNA invertase Pin-like site-specific DNA recombinase